MENSRGQNRNSQGSLDQQKSRLSESEGYSGQQQQNVSSGRGSAFNETPLQNVSGSRGGRQRQENMEQENSSSESESLDQDVSSARGGTTDVSRNRETGERGRTDSGITTKRNITGSDYDGQVSPE